MVMKVKWKCFRFHFHPNTESLSCYISMNKYNRNASDIAETTIRLTKNSAANMKVRANACCVTNRDCKHRTRTRAYVLYVMTTGNIPKCECVKPQNILLCDDLPFTFNVFGAYNESNPETRKYTFNI